MDGPTQLTQEELTCQSQSQHYDEDYTGVFEAGDGGKVLLLILDHFKMF